MFIFEGTYFITTEHYGDIGRNVLYQIITTKCYSDVQGNVIITERYGHVWGNAITVERCGDVQRNVITMEHYDDLRGTYVIIEKWCTSNDTIATHVTMCNEQFGVD